MTGGSAPTGPDDEGGDAPCWAHLLEEDDATVLDGSAQREPREERTGEAAKKMAELGETCPD